MPRRHQDKKATHVSILTICNRISPYTDQYTEKIIHKIASKPFNCIGRKNLYEIKSWRTNFHGAHSILSVIFI